ncbi:MAG: hypothetical protein PF440_07290 [Thiomicrorhabdus sp.]|jgi:hypothetical protein|nr:hypothetical protein [Thiomicrorhabdus sp.]
MKNLIKSIIAKNTILSTWFHRNIRPGQVYIHRDFVSEQKNPFLEDRDKYKLRVIDVKDGWVKCGGINQRNSIPRSMKISAFNFTYRLFQEAL